MNMRSTLSAAALCIAAALSGPGTAQAAAKLSLAPVPQTAATAPSGKADAPIVLAQNRQFRGGGNRGASRPAFRGGGGGGAARQFRGGGGGQQFRAARPAFRGGSAQQFRARRPAFQGAPRQVFRGGRAGVRGPVVSGRRASSYPRFRSRRSGYNYYYNGWWYPNQWWLPAAAVGVGVGVGAYGGICNTYHVRCGRRYGYYTYNYEVCMRDYYGCY